MKPVNLNQLLFHSSSSTLSFFQPPLLECQEFDTFIGDMQVQLELQSKFSLGQILEKEKSSIKKILKSHPEKSHGFFISEEIQGYVVLDTPVESYCMIGRSFHVRPLVEELFVNPEYLLVNVSLYDIKIYRGDFQHLEIIQQYEFDQLAASIRSHLFTPKNVGLIPYKTILALKTIAQKVMDLAQYHSIPVIVTGLEDMKQIFLKYFTHTFGVITHFQEDFYEKTCVQIVEKCRQFRFAVMDYYSAQFKERLKKLMKSKRLISDLGDIIKAASEGRIVHLVLPTEKKLYGKLDFETGGFEIHKKHSPKDASVDILNELAEVVMREGGRIQILGPHFFPADSHVLAILKG